MGVQLKHKEEKIDFRRKQKHGLKGILKDLTDEWDTLLPELVKLAKSTDERIKMQALSKLWDMRKECEQIINTDDIQRMLLESKNPDRVRGLIEDDDTPDVDFTQIQNV